jgi:hypothetical protein
MKHHKSAQSGHFEDIPLCRRHCRHPPDNMFLLRSSWLCLPRKLRGRCFWRIGSLCETTFFRISKRHSLHETSSVTLGRSKKATVPRGGVPHYRTASSVIYSHRQDGRNPPGQLAWHGRNDQFACWRSTESPRRKEPGCPNSDEDIGRQDVYPGGRIAPSRKFCTIMQ